MSCKDVFDCLNNFKTITMIDTRYFHFNNLFLIAFRSTFLGKCVKVTVIGRSCSILLKCKITEPRKQKLKLKFYMIQMNFEKNFLILIVFYNMVSPNLFHFQKITSFKLIGTKMSNCIKKLIFHIKLLKTRFVADDKWRQAPGIDL